MTDVQVSNARRIGFTALAIVSLWILTLREYSIACSDLYGAIIFCEEVPETEIHLTNEARRIFFELDEASLHSVYLAASMALVPMVFLMISVSNSLSRALDYWIAVSAALTVATVLAARWLGMGYSWMDAHYGLESSALPKMFGPLDSVFQPRSELAARHEVSWFWLLLPLTLTTAFVIFGAWRRAVRDADVEAVGGAE